MNPFARSLAALLLLAATTAVHAQEASVPEPMQVETAVFAGGCFWCVEEAFDEVEGVLTTTSGYTGGDVENPSYEQVSAGGTGHYEAVRVRYDPERVSYDTLLQTFWHNIDPTDPDGQFCDQGSSYRSAIFWRTPAQREQAEASKAALEQDPDAPSHVTTEILRAGAFYEAEGYHQDYYRKNPLRYRFYKTACGREGRLEELWGDRAGQP
jgi:peptide-methionine (S)-S-oxide reductase